MEDSRNLDVSSNPFTALFPSVEQAEAYSRQQTQPTSNSQGNNELESQEVTSHTCPLALSLKHSVDSVSESDPTNQPSNIKNDNDDNDKPQMINDLLQRVFLITIDPDRSRVGRREYGGLPKRCVYLKNTASDSEVPLIHWTNIDEALMERLMMSYPRTHVMITGGAYGTALTAEIEAGESGVIKYLVACYRRATEDQKKWKGKSPEFVKKAEKARTLTVSYAGTCLLSPEVFSKSDPQKQLFHLLLTVQGDPVVRDFMDRLVQEHCRKDDLTCMFMPVLTMLKERSSDITSLVQPDVHNYLNILSFFGRHKELTEILLLSDSWFPPKLQIGDISGRAFEKQSIIGSLLGLTSMSQDPTKPSEFFQRPAEQSQSEMQATMANLRTHLNSLAEGLHKVVLEIMRRSNESRHGVLHWIGACLYSNLSRKKMMGELFAATQSQDGFFLNLSMLLLKLCQPFMDGNSPKLLKIDPQYCAVRTTVNSIANKNTGVHLVGLDKETRLVVPTNEEHITVENPPAFGFVTECFFMTHFCLNLGLWKVCEKYRKLMTDLNQMQQVYQEASSHGSEGLLIDRLKVQFENGIIKQLSLKTHLLNPSLIELSLRFYIATASWLNQVALAGDNFDNMTVFRDVEIPLPSQTPPGLLFVPEFIVETMGDFIIFLRHFSEETLESAGRSLQHLVTFFVIYMGSPERVRNPHLRAKLAETVEALIPVQRSNMSSGLLAGSQINMFNRQLAFLQHSVAPAYLPQALLRLFVDIEFTGHTMQFEQKFGYRHHMYSVLHFMWNQENYKATLLKLGEEAAEAETKMTSNLPVFLRFLNLLINDSIFLLDEALQYMTTLKKLQSERENGLWDSLSEQARQQKQQELQQTGGMARSHNILANETVRALSYITADIKRPFLSGCMRRRIADMLNYFLLHLVGPKMGALKVKDFSEFHFKPQQLVLDIVDIYLNLGQDDSFCQAVATDDRSYSPSLFVQSERVLKLIGRPASIVKLNELARRVKEFAQQEKADADDMPEPPEEFVDPITNIIMDDPVTLPTSSIVVDRATICRHLLSDQTDPFSRRPLTLEMIEPNDGLKARIQNWMKEVKAQKKR